MVYLENNPHARLDNLRLRRAPRFQRSPEGLQAVPFAGGAILSKLGCEHGASPCTKRDGTAFRAK